MHHLNTVGNSLRRLDGSLRAATSSRAFSVQATSPTSTGTIEIFVNGELREVAPGVTVAGLVEELGLTRRKIAIAIGRDVIPRGSYSARALHAGDRVEILEAVGGG
jgi:sulfur carrier protein